MKNIFRFIILAFTIVAISCDDNTVNEPSLPPDITSFSKNETYNGDTIFIYGNNLGTGEIGDMVVFSDSLLIKPQHTEQWLVQRIRVVVPANAVTGPVFVISNGDTSNSLILTINSLPPLETENISAGTFARGSDKGFADEQPVKQISISKSFIISKYEITQLFYEAVTGNNPSTYLNNDFPVNNVSWLDAITFCNALSKKEGLDTAYTILNDQVIWNDASNGWRIPTEAEWEYACRAGTTGDFNVNDDPAKLAWYNSNSGFNFHSPGMKLPNSWGLYDMHGNLWEWCWDYYDPAYYAVSALTDPAGPESGQRHVARGGSYTSGLSFIRCANRRFDNPSDEMNKFGIRIVRNN